MDKAKKKTCKCEPGHTGSLCETKGCSHLKACSGNGNQYLISQVNA